MGKHARAISRKTNPQLVGLVSRLYSLSAKEKSKLWRDVAQRLEGPAKARPSVNLSKLDRYCDDGETVLIPGKLLGAGNISKKVTVSAFAHSGSAARKLAEAGCSLVSIDALAQSNPAGSKIKIII